MAKQLFTALAALAALVAGRKYNTSSGVMTGALNIHLVPHTHDDVGNVKTMDQYFWGANFSVQNAGVQCVLDSVLDALRKNPDRRFIYVEQAFFDMWWRHADAEDQAAVRALVASGQLELINGGWVMHDEAGPSYVDMIDQTTLGVRNIKTRFNVAPKVTWQIDPFGHSGVQSSLLTAASGYLGLFPGRADYQDVAARQNSSSLEFMWQASPSQPALLHFTDILSSSFQDVYSPPAPGFSFDIRGSGFQAIVDDPESPEYNVPWWVEQAVQAAQQHASYIRPGSDGTRHIMWTCGQDFEYIAAQSYFTNLDRLIHYLNLDGRVNAFYSTPSIYTEAKLAQVAAGQVQLPTTNNADMMPFASNPHSMWSGYFTSRPALKGYVRDSSSLLQAARQSQAYTGAGSDPDTPSNSMFHLERAQAVLQHHDAVAGTERQHVAYDYARMLGQGRNEAEAGMSTDFSSLTGWTGAPFAFCDLANASICSATENAVPGSPVALLLWNSLGQALEAAPVRVPVGTPTGVTSYSVTGPDQQQVQASLLPLSEADSSLRTEYYKASPTSMSWLAFLASVPPSGYALYVLQPVAQAQDAPRTSVWAEAPIEAESMAADRVLRGSSMAAPAAATVLSNGVVTLTFDSTGNLASWSAPTLGIQPMPFTQSWAWYNSSTGDAACPGCISSAYHFRPNGTTPFPVSTSPVSLSLVTPPGGVVQEARQTFAPWLSQVIRLYGNRSDVEFEWTVGPIPTADGLGKEVITRYSVPSLNNAGSWYTDSNGRDMYRRERDRRPTWNYSVQEPVAGNYYPVNTRISMSDATRGLTLNVAVDRTQGGSSIIDGSLEMMVHRRTLANISGFMHEALNEPGIDWTGSGLVVRGVHRVRLDANLATAAVAGRSMMQDLLYPPRQAWTPLPEGTAPVTWLASHKARYQGLAAPLASNVHLLTVHSYSPTSLLLRLAHLYSIDDPAPASSNATVDMAGLFSDFQILQAQEMNLIANMDLQEVQDRYSSVGLGHMAAAAFPGLTHPPSGPGLTVSLAPMQIRTFLCSTTPQGAQLQTKAVTMGS